jgi:pimeloyl-ACP methyl ester carboxylesterase
VAIHTNMPVLGMIDAAERYSAERGTYQLTEEDRLALAAVAHFAKWESGYAKQQSTRPQTVGYGLVDSPVAQLAWIVEKFWAWMDCDGHPENVVSRDELLDNVMMYWATRSGASSARMYWEHHGAPSTGARVELPTGVAAFPKEISRSPRSWCEANYNITRWTTMPRGGHFAAFEQPGLFVDDVRAFFATVR